MMMSTDASKLLHYDETDNGPTLLALWQAADTPEEHRAHFVYEKHMKPFIHALNPVSITVLATVSSHSTTRALALSPATSR